MTNDLKAIEALQDSVEAECHGLAIDDAQAKAIIAHVFPFLSNQLDQLRRTRDDLHKANNQYLQESRDVRAKLTTIEKERDLMAREWCDFCEAMGVTVDTQEAVAYELQSRTEASAAVKVDVDAIMQFIEDTMIEAEVDFPAGREAGPRISYDDDGIRVFILSALSPAPQEAEAVVDECEREDQINALPHPDDAPVADVLAYVLSCARLWQPEARIIGNARAGDIVRALSHPPAPAVTEAMVTAMINSLDGIAILSRAEARAALQAVQEVKP